MDIKYIKELNSAVHSFFNDNGFSSKGQDTGIYMGENKTFKISYSDERKEFSLSAASIVDDISSADFKVLATWYFDEASHGPNDIQCIAEDFISTAAKAEGIKLTTDSAPDTSNVALPGKAILGEQPGIEAFAQKFLAMFPQYKQNYKEMIATYGDFLYVTFFKDYAVEKMCELNTNETANKKQLKKYWDMLGDMHYEGETVVGDIICSVIIAGTFKGNVEAFTTVADKYLSDYPFLKTAGLAAVNNYRSDKKLRAVLD